MNITQTDLFTPTEPEELGKDGVPIRLRHAVEPPPPKLPPEETLGEMRQRAKIRIRESNIDAISWMRRLKLRDDGTLDWSDAEKKGWQSVWQHDHARLLAAIVQCASFRDLNIGAVIEKYYELTPTIQWSNQKARWRCWGLKAPIPHDTPLDPDGNE